jgi:hypothetical protein
MTSEQKSPMQERLTSLRPTVFCRSEDVVRCLVQRVLHEGRAGQGEHA